MFACPGLIFYTVCSVPWLNGNLALAEKCSGPLRFRLRQVLLYMGLRSSHRGFFSHVLLLVYRWMRKCTLQHWYLSTRLNVVTSQKAVTLIVTPVITKNFKISQCSVHVSNQISRKSYTAVRSYPDYRYFTYISTILHSFPVSYFR